MAIRIPAPAGAELQNLPFCKAARPLASLCEGGVKTFGFDGGRDDFRLGLRKTVRRGGALPLPPFLHDVSGGVEPRPYTLKYRTAQRLYPEI